MLDSTSSPAEDGFIGWRDFSLSEEDLAELRSALCADGPHLLPLTDDDIRQMGYDTLQFLALMLALKKNRAA